MFFALYLILLGLFLSGVLPGTVEAASPKQSQIKTLKFSEKDTHLDISLIMPKGKALLAYIDKEAEDTYSLTMKGQKFKFSFYDRPFNIQTLHLRQNDHEDVFFVTQEDEWNDLFLFCPQELEVMKIEISPPIQKMIPPFNTITRSENFGNYRLREERIFLEQRKYEHGYLEEVESDKKNRTMPHITGERIMAKLRMA